MLHIYKYDSLFLYIYIYIYKTLCKNMYVLSSVDELVTDYVLVHWKLIITLSESHIKKIHVIIYNAFIFHC